MKKGRKRWLIAALAALLAAVEVVIPGQVTDVARVVLEQPAHLRDVPPLDAPQPLGNRSFGL